MLSWTRVDHIIATAVGGLIVIAIDMTTGAPFDLSPSPFNVSLNGSSLRPIARLRRL